MKRFVPLHQGYKQRRMICQQRKLLEWPYLRVCTATRSACLDISPCTTKQMQTMNPFDIIHAKKVSLLKVVPAGIWQVWKISVMRLESLSASFLWTKKYTFKDWSPMHRASTSTKEFETTSILAIPLLARARVLSNWIFNLSLRITLKMLSAKVFYLPLILS